MAIHLVQNSRNDEQLYLQKKNVLSIMAQFNCQESVLHSEPLPNILQYLLFVVMQWLCKHLYTYSFSCYTLINEIITSLNVLVKCIFYFRYQLLCSMQGFTGSSRGLAAFWSFEQGGERMKVCLTKGEFQERCSDVFFSFKADQYKVEQYRNDLIC